MSQTEQHSQQHHDEDEEEEECPLFSCRCESARAVSTLLSCLKHVGVDAESSAASSRHHRTTPVTVFCSPASLTFHVHGKSRQSQASVDMQAGLFSEYLVKKNHVHDHENETNDGGEFCVNLYTVLDCLHVLGSTGLETTRLCLAYDLNTEIFRMELLDDRGVLSTAAIPGMLPPDQGASLALAFRSTPICARVIVASHLLKEAMHELEAVGGATTCTICIQQGLELATIGDVGECLVSLPSASTVSCEASQNQKARTYPLHSFQSGMKALDIAQETCISINQDGMMAIQHQVLDTVGSGSPNYVDFIMSCLQDEDDENGTVVAAEEPEESSSSIPLLLSQRSQLSQRSHMSWNDNDNNRNHPLDLDRSSQNGSGSDNDHDDFSPQPPPVAPIPPLYFGSVVVGRGTSPQPRRKRQPARRPLAVHHSHDAADSSDDDASRNLLEEEESQPLDVTAPAFRPRRTRTNQDHDGSSSPEVVYGDMTQDEY